MKKYYKTICFFLFLFLSVFAEGQNQYDMDSVFHYPHQVKRGISHNVNIDNPDYWIGKDIGTLITLDPGKCKAEDAELEYIIYFDCFSVPDRLAVIDENDVLTDDTGFVGNCIYEIPYGYECIPGYVFIHEDIVYNQFNIPLPYYFLYHNDPFHASHLPFFIGNGAIYHVTTQDKLQLLLHHNTFNVTAIMIHWDILNPEVLVDVNYDTIYIDAGISCDVSDTTHFIYSQTNGCTINTIKERLIPTQFQYTVSSSVSVCDSVFLNFDTPYEAIYINGQLRDQGQIYFTDEGTADVLIIDPNGCEHKYIIEVINNHIGENNMEEILIRPDIASLDYSDYINIWWSDGYEGYMRNITSDTSFSIIYQDRSSQCWGLDHHNYMFVKDDLYVPNVFSPNGDGINDEFKVYFNVYLNIKSFNIQIYDRWGGIIYESDDIGFLWTLNDKHVNSNVFLYKITYETEKEEYQIAGEVLVLF